jgi:hypothetical protein
MFGALAGGESVESGVAAGDLVVHGQDSMLSCEVWTAVVQCRDFGQDFGGLDIK